ncbi:2-amino-5-chloromuconic acid deaminase [Paraconexibacter sp. AEG42_29]|uniref:2-amino-5-chloromuconic acid deaminase n=1 Tax=Paraconexibacter sp. AEG42_29 TaxID=2997339 RepID=A0AAU7ARW0_9ACTN
MIAARDVELRACTHVPADAARSAALAEGGCRRRGGLRGWTVAVKDNTDVMGTVRTDGLPPPHPAVAGHDAEAVRRLRSAGAVVVAKANLEELSFAATTQNRTFGSCRNPWDTGRIPGGSSGGSAVAVAAGYVDLALGTDTGGSIRNPAAFCGVSGLRPSRGTVPIGGVTPLAPSFDVVGPIARTAAELRVAFAVVAGTGPPPEPVAAGLLAGLRVGVPRAFFFDDLQPAVAAGVDAVLAALRGAGAALVAVDLPGAADTGAALAVLLNGEAAQLHGAALEDPRIDEQIKERLRLGLATTTAAREGAAAIAERWRAVVDSALADVELLLVPTVPTVAPVVAGASMVEVSRRVNRNTAPWSLALLPALSLPCPVPAGALPVGVQLVGRAGADTHLLDAGAALQAITGPPPLATL